MNFSRTYLEETAAIASTIDDEVIERIALSLAEVRDRGGRLFILGAGGGAGHASHAVNDFRKLCGLEAYAPSDNVSELTARINDDGWDTAYSNILRGSRLCDRDALLVFSVGGGSVVPPVSTSLVSAIDLANERGAYVAAIIGRSAGHAASHATDCCIVPHSHVDRITPHTEAFQAIVWHLLVSHPRLATSSGHWESLQRAI